MDSGLSSGTAPIAAPRDPESGTKAIVTDDRTTPMSPGGDGDSRVVRTSNPTTTSPQIVEVAQAVEAVIVSTGGGLLLIGWVDDARDPLMTAKVSGATWSLEFSGEELARVRRQDVEKAYGANLNYPYGYYGFIYSGEDLATGDMCVVTSTLASGRQSVSVSEIRLGQDAELRDTLLSYIAQSHHFGNGQIKAIEGFDRGAAFEVLRLNRAITKSVCASPYVERFGRKGATYDGSLIVCLYGKAEFLFLQSSLFGACKGFERYEFIYVCNSPELAEALLSEARAATLIYGVDITIVLLAGNAGFGAANNVAARYARSGRILIVNPDVLPVDGSWADRHSQILASRPEDQLKMFGAALYYDDGSLMHGGMFFELDRGVTLDQGRHRAYRLLRVQHYGKGSPAEMTTFTRPRPVPAVTGAFISADRAWFERLGGFTEDFVFGHYEDADLCLKSLQAGSPVWIQDLKLWHLEGKGSTRLSAHEGGSLINRWLFSTTWGEVITDNLLGSEPSHSAFRPEYRLRLKSDAGASAANSTAATG